MALRLAFRFLRGNVLAPGAATAARRARASSAERCAARELEALRAAVAERRAELAALG